MADKKISISAADGHVYEIEETSEKGYHAGTVTSFIGWIYFEGLDIHAQYRSYLSFDTSEYASISSMYLYFWVHLYSQPTPPPGEGWRIGCKSGDDVIGPNLTTSAYANSGFDVWVFDEVFSGVGWKNWLITDYNLSGCTDFEVLPNWDREIGEDDYIAIRQSEFASYEPYLLIDGVKKSKKRGVSRLFPRVRLIRPVRFK